MVFVGDFYQLQPVGSSIFKEPKVHELCRNNRNESYKKAIEGYKLQKKLDLDVIELTKNHRQPDPKWANALENFRINQPTKEDIALVNQRVLLYNDGVTSPKPPSNTVIAVPENKSREHRIKYILNEILNHLPTVMNDDNEQTHQKETWKERGIILIQVNKENNTKVKYGTVSRFISRQTSMQKALKKPNVKTE